MKALSLYQPWGWLIVHGYKNVENRSWQTHFRGQFLVCASVKLDILAARMMLSGKHPVTQAPLMPRVYKHFAEDWEANRVRRGGIVGVADLIETVHIKDPIAAAYTSEWFVGPIGFLLKNAQPLPFIPVKGMQKFFDVDDDLVRSTLAKHQRRG